MWKTPRKVMQCTFPKKLPNYIIVFGFCYEIVNAQYIQAFSVTHGCIIAMVRLIDCDGSEANEQRSVTFNHQYTLLPQLVSLTFSEQKMAISAMYLFPLDRQQKIRQVFCLLPLLCTWRCCVADEISSANLKLLNFNEISGPTADSGNGVIVSQQQMFQLHQYIREAAHREEMQNQKLMALQVEIVDSVHAYCANTIGAGKLLDRF